MKKVNPKNKEETLDAKTWETNLALFKQQHGKIKKYKKVDDGEAMSFYWRKQNISENCFSQNINKEESECKEDRRHIERKKNDWNIFYVVKNNREK
jgi:hypothetical protein